MGTSGLAVPVAAFAPSGRGLLHPAILAALRELGLTDSAVTTGAGHLEADDEQDTTLLLSQAPKQIARAVTPYAGYASHRHSLRSGLGPEGESGSG